MSGIARLQLRQLAQQGARFSSPALRPSTSFSPSASIFLARQLSISPVLSAAGQGGKEFKAKKASKKVMTGGKGGKGKKGSAVEEDEDDGDDFDWSSGGSSKSSGKKSASKRTLEPEPSDIIEAELSSAEEKMKKAVGWLSDKYQESLGRLQGQVSVAALDPVRVVISKEEGEVPISQLGTVSSKNNALIIDIFDEEHTKAVENAINKANLRGMSPNRVNSRQIKIVVGRPSDKDQKELSKMITASSDQVKTQVRTARGAGLKVVGKDGTKEFQTLHDKYIKQIDEQLKKAKTQLADLMQ